MLSFLHTIHRLKETKRTGWINSGISHPESIADHMYRMAIIAMLVDEPVNRDKLIKMALVHDMAEAIVGDITPYDGVSQADKHRMELNAMESFVAQLGNSAYAQEMLALWKEYEAAETPEALLCKDIDKFEMILQAHDYETDEHGHGRLDQFFASTEGKFKSASIKKLADQLTSERKQFQMTTDFGQE